MNAPDLCPMCSRPVCCELELCNCDTDPTCLTCHSLYAHQETTP
jgi:hypothetical protein